MLPTLFLFLCFYAVPLTFSLWPARTSTPAGGEDEGTDENYEEEEEENNGGEAGDEKGDESDSKNVTGETFRPTCQVLCPYQVLTPSQRSARSFAHDLVVTPQAPS
ncbi:hypothetical protein F441_19340 [Phytophthora nicotianae CJ01A1]|uniref:RxLR effector protein n=3 Tax=Phytophthora nicotianae TaxID=4792 RepID=W2VZH6_PHYNI|nr:hypothetical protein F441_19340 [Phytophthora nicotianae CJ01A1]